ncbi:MAG: tyrosyl-tRNA synthetase [Candidatus Thermoplasmatota archaeon]|nr:tyrosyl-tRNA synthetase [Candidatus Thermoplasmatota archaeon]
MDVERRMELATKGALEIVTEPELRTLFETNDSPSAYIGFEPSGYVHIGQFITAAKMAELQEAGVRLTVFLADWHAMINDKFGGDIKSIRVCGDYMRECFLALGVKDSARFVWANDLVGRPEYWEKFIRICKASTLMRIKRAMTIMGRTEDEAELDASKVMYPPMQAADIFQLEADIALAGMDQRRAHMLARDAAEKLGWKKPVALHTPLLMSLVGSGRMDPVEAKMSKSDPNSAIFLHDRPEDISRKMKNAFCPPEAENNPVLDVMRLIVFPKLGAVNIDRPAKYGGPLSFSSYDELAKTYASKGLHPQDLKKGAADSLVTILAPVRDHFQKRPETIDRLKGLTITR